MKIASHAVRSLERQQVRRASAVSYVSPSLQVLYPPGDEMLAHVCSNVVLPDFVSAAAGRVLHTDDEARLVSVGRLEPEKGHLVLLEALSILAVRDDVPRVRATLVGEDMAAEERRLRARAKELGPSLLDFQGQVPQGEAVERLVRAADILGASFLDRRDATGADRGHGGRCPCCRHLRGRSQ